MRKLLTAVFVTAVAAAAIPAVADHDIDIHVNGDFRGRPSGSQLVPGWTLTADGGAARLLPGRKQGEAMLELRSTPYRGQSAVSDLHAIRGRVLKLEVNVSGSGAVSVGYELFDSARRPIRGGGEMVRTGLGVVETEFRHYFTLKVPGAAYMQLRLTAEPNSTAVFRDVEAEWNTHAAPPPPAPAPAPGVIPAPPPAGPGAPPPPPPPHGGPYGKPLANGAYYSFASLARMERFQTSLPVGAKIRFDLGENPPRREFWRVSGYDAARCRVRLEHVRGGFDRHDRAVVEVKALRPGVSVVELDCGGKRMQIQIHAR